MKFLNTTTKYRMSILVVMVMLLQMLMPVVGDVVWAEELMDPEVVEEQELGETMEESNGIVDQNDDGDDTPEEDTESDDNILTEPEESKDEGILGIDINELNGEKEIEDNSEDSSNVSNEFPYIIGVEIKDENGDDFLGPVKKDSKIRIDYKFEIPNEEIVDTEKSYTIKIPELIKITKEMRFEAKNGDRVLAVATFNNDNEMIIQYMDEVNNPELLYDRIGYFWVYTEFDAAKVGVGGETEIEFDIGGESKKIIEINFEKEEEKVDVKLSKSGHYDKENNIIIWTITVKPETTPSGRTISNVVITDVIEKGQTYIDDSANIDPNTEGEGSFSFEGNRLSYTFNEAIKSGDEYTITFKTKPDLSAFNSEGKTIYFKNKAEATFEDDGESTSNEASVDTTVDFIRKEGEFEKGNSREENRIDWTIHINNNNLKIDNAVIRDTIPKGLKLVTDTIKLEPELTGASYSIEGNENAETGTELTYELGEITGYHKLTYSTTVVDEEAYNSNTSKEYKNYVEITGVDVPTNANNKDDKDGVLVPTSVIVKSGKGYNPSTQEITWEIVVNNNKIAIENAEVTDHIPLGLEYVEGSFKVDGNIPISGFEYMKADSEDASKTGTWVYNFGNINQTTHIITFKTRVTDNNIWANNANKTFYNTAKLTGDGVKDSSSTGEEHVSSQVIKKTGIGYHYLDREATWEIVINQNKMPMINVVVTDVIGEYQEFVEGSVEVTGPSKEKTAINFDNETKTLTIGFLETINDTHTITFKTKINDESIFYSNGDKTLYNTAKLESNETPENGVSSTGNNKIQNTVVNKTGNYEDGNDYIDWEVVINQNQLSIYDAILEDELQEGLELDTSSVKLIKLIVDEEGDHKEGEEVELSSSNIKYNGETRKFEFHFTEEINEAYILKFRTDILDTHKNATFMNTINFKGSNRAETGSSESIKVSFQTGGGGAGASGRGSIKIIKVDENNNSTKLSGAVFELLDIFENVLKTSEPTGDNGEALFGGLKFDTTYLIREKTPPAEYALSGIVHKFQVKNETGKKDIEYEFKNTKIKGNIEFTKYGDNQEPLQGAGFALYNADDNDFEYPITTVSSDKDGKVKFENIAFGSYKIKETKAPEGYLLSDEVLEATISEDDSTVSTIPESISNTMIKGNFQLKKIRKNTDTPLSGAKIAVYREDGTFIEEQTTDDDGFALFEKLPYGRYYFIETKAPSGYYRNNEKHYFNIEEDGVTVEETLENIKIPPYGPPTDPKDPKPEKPTKPTKPEDPEKPMEPTKPADPEGPANPEDPLTDIDGETPAGGIDVDKEDDDDPTIGLDDNTPKGGTNVDKPILPKTGENNNIFFYFIGLILITLGFVFRRKTV